MGSFLLKRSNFVNPHGCRYLPDIMEWRDSTQLSSFYSRNPFQFPKITKTVSKKSGTNSYILVFRRNRCFQGKSIWNDFNFFVINNSCSELSTYATKLHPFKLCQYKNSTHLPLIHQSNSSPPTFLFRLSSALRT